MGVYLNSEDDDGSKATILTAIKSLVPISRGHVKNVLPCKGNAFLCLVDNGLFAALGVLYDERERDAFIAPDSSRVMRFYEASIDEIKPFLAAKDAEHITLGQQVGK